jgi:hypothetical protein
MDSIKPFANESESLEISGLTIENRTDRVQMYGQIHLTRDKAGLADAKALRTIIDAVIKVLESEKDLPEQVTLKNKPRAAKNPFA